MRDLTEKQFRDAVKRNGMTFAPFGYVEIDGGKLAVNRMNGGWRFRSQLAYLLREKAKYEADVAKQQHFVDDSPLDK